MPRVAHKLLPWTLALVLSATAGAVGAQADKLPDRSQWRASSSSTDNPAMLPSMAIDNDHETYWGGAFSANHWLQIDLSAPASIGGALIHWAGGFAASYRIMTSLDGKSFQTVFETTDGRGGLDYLFFPAVQARYVRLASVRLSADWGVSVLEFEPVSASEAPRVQGLKEGVDPATIWGGSATPPRAVGPTRTVTIKLPRPLPTTGLEVAWGGGFKQVQLEGREAKGGFRQLAADYEPSPHSLLAARKPITATELRLRIRSDDTTPSIRRMRLLPADYTLTPQRRYEVAASRAHRGLFPPQLRNEQVYWTVVGIPAGQQKSIFDEYGNLEAWKAAPMVQPLWRDSEHNVHAAHQVTPTQTLREGWIPMPSVEWSPQPGLSMRSEAITIDYQGQPVTLLRHRLQNTGDHRIDGELSLLVRPAQVNPRWQSGGISPIHKIAIEGPLDDTRVRVNGRLLFRSLSPVQGRGAASFGEHGEGELTQTVAWGAPPTALSARDDDGLAAASLRYTVKLGVSDTTDIVLAFPLGNQQLDAWKGNLPDAPAVPRSALLRDTSPGIAFDQHAADLSDDWRERLSRFDLSLPDRSYVNMLRAQLAYMLLNQTGHAIQPGPRNYNRSYVRDGAATAIVLMRVGITQIARDYLRWYTDHALHDNGLVSPILNNDGTVNKGFGSDIEYDSQGEYVNLVADIARLDGGAQTVKEYMPKVKLALRFLQQLRERTLVEGYQSNREAPERFRGILAPSISHEGYPVPTHSYWDDFWGLKGWYDGAWLASGLGDAQTEVWARAQYALLREAFFASIEATMKWKGIDTIPSSADDGGYDPTGTSIGLDPCGQISMLPLDPLQRTFDRFLGDVRKRALSDSVWAYTPYEMRNVLSYVHLNRPQDADELLKSLMNHRRPKAWQEFAEVVHSRLRHPGYLGDMPHTWIGAEYVRTIFGMLMHEADDHIVLLPGTPPEWLHGDGLAVTELRTSHGRLTMSAQQNGAELRLKLGPGLAAHTPVVVKWPSRTRPSRLIVDGKPRTDQTFDSVTLDRPFKELVAQW